jgi:DNA oxidative demethylase
MKIIEGVTFYSGYFNREAQKNLRDIITEHLNHAPLFTPRMPKTDKPFSVQMSNAGSLGWVSDKQGYRYQAHHPNGQKWGDMPQILHDLWRDVAGFLHPPEACLINRYEASSKMGLHQDRDEEDFTAPVVSVSLGASALFRIGGVNRTDKTQSVKLHSGDVLVFGGEARLIFHGIDRLYANSTTLIDNDARINLTLRRVNLPL